jgi:hypothetical protein
LPPTEKETEILEVKPGSTHVDGALHLVQNPWQKKFDGPSIQLRGLSSNFTLLVRGR